MTFVDVVLDLFSALCLVLGSISIGYFLLRVGWPKVRVLDRSYKAGWSIVLGAIFTIIIVFGAALLSIIPFFSIGFRGFMFVGLVASCIVAAVVLTVRRKFFARKRVSVSIPKDVVGARIASQKIMQRFEEGGLTAVARLDERKVSALREVLAGRKKEEAEPAQKAGTKVGAVEGAWEQPTGERGAALPPVQEKLKAQAIGMKGRGQKPFPGPAGKEVRAEAAVKAPETERKLEEELLEQRREEEEEGEEPSRTFVAAEKKPVEKKPAPEEEPELGWEAAESAAGEEKEEEYPHEPEEADNEEKEMKDISSIGRELEEMGKGFSAEQKRGVKKKEGKDEEQPEIEWGEEEPEGGKTGEEVEKKEKDVLNELIKKLKEAEKK